jgi:hypothetical protein
LSPEEINSYLNYQETASLYSPDGVELDKLFDTGSNNGVLPKSGFFNDEQTLSIDKNWLVGTYKIRVNLNVTVLDSDIELNPMQTETPVIVGNFIKAPTINKTVSLGTISGASPTHVSVEVTGGDKDSCILFSQSNIRLTAAPKDVSYSIKGNCVTIPAGQTVNVAFDISPDPGSRGNAVGVVDGQFKFKAQLIDSKSTILDMAPVSFHGYQDAAPNDIARWALIALFMVISGLLAYLLLVMISKAVAKFPKNEQVTRLHLQSISFPVRVSRYEIKSLDTSISQKLDDLDLPQWIQVTKNRKSAMVSGFNLVAKASGIKLASAGYAELEGDFLGFGGPAATGAPEKHGKAVVGLGLQNTWMLLFNKAELLSKVADDNFQANAQLILIIDANAPSQAKNQLVGNAESTVGSPALEHLVDLANKVESSSSDTSGKSKRPPKAKKTKDKKNSNEDIASTPSAPTDPTNDPWAF